MLPNHEFEWSIYRNTEDNQSEDFSLFSMNLSFAKNKGYTEKLVIFLEKKLDIKFTKMEDNWIISKPIIDNNYTKNLDYFLQNIKPLNRYLLFRKSVYRKKR